ncbi:MAG: ethylbenzene dehydrogenase-related protein [Candidatus Poribacteria bacterium]
MKKNLVILIATILVASFAALVYYGFRHSRGAPSIVEKSKRVILEVPFIDKDIDLSEGISLDLWNSITEKEIELMYQVMVLPWGKSLVSPITVKAFHNKRDIYFYISWKDDTRDGNAKINKFSDACAIMFPMGDNIQSSTIMMGFMGKSNIWQWKASQDEEYWSKKPPETGAYTDFYYPFEEKELFVVSKTVPQSAINDLISKMPGTITPKETQNVQGRGFWDKSVWHVVFKRSLEPAASEFDAVFKPEEKKLIAFAVWNGATGDRGGRKSISDWVELEIKL